MAIATLRPDLHFWTKKFTADSSLVVYVDVPGVLGTTPVQKWEYRHVKRQMQKLEKAIDKITGNSFDIIVQKDSPEGADVEVTAHEDLEAETGYAAIGLWNVGSYARNGIGQVQFMPVVHGVKRSRKQTKQLISHEIGHMFGLGHPATGFHGSHPETVMGGHDYTNKYLTKSDMELIARLWEMPAATPAPRLFSKPTFDVEPTE